MFLLIDKPSGITSHGVISRIRALTGERKVGHAGTLDPNATGLLIVAVGRKSTKQLGHLTTKATKIYEASIVLGEYRDTDDVAGETLEIVDSQPPSEWKIDKVLKSFIGTSQQMPPAYSAIKISGQKAYALARKGQKPQLTKRKITIYSIELTKYHYPRLDITLKVSSGTYIRALARDLGAKLGTGGYLGGLRRTQVGKYKLSNAVALDELTSDNWKNFAFTID